MAERVVVTHTRGEKRGVPKDFTFTSQMIPSIGSDALKEYRQHSWEIYNRTPMPSSSDEPWRRTNITGLQAGVFKLPERNHPGLLPAIPEDFLRSVADEDYAGQVLLAPEGGFVKLDPVLAAKGVVFTDFENAEQNHAALMKRILGKVVRPEEGKFSALVGAFARQGVLLYVPPFVQIEQPLHSILWGPGVSQAYFSHILVLVDKGASLTYVHEYASPTEIDGQTLHAGVIEIHVEEDANLNFVELQSWGEHVWNFNHERARVGRNAKVDWILGAIGSHLTKNFSDLELVEQGAVGRMSGFYFTDGNQHLDHDTQQNHMAPNTTSDLLFKGALREHSRSVWQGMIYVAPGAQKTDGYQANRNLVLSPEARADSIPGLEILADDVRCTHGATVGKIDADQVFYLRSRGIPYQEAERLIVEGFFDPIMQRIPFEGVRTRFQDAIKEKMG